MRIKYYLIFIFCFLACKRDDDPVNQPPPPQAQRGDIVTKQYLRSYTVAQVNLIINAVAPSLSSSIQAQYPLDLYKIIYETVDVNGDPITASGAFLVPRGSASFPLASYQHGTSVQKIDVPSRQNLELNIGVIIASLGYVMAMPDYLGLGDSPGLHPYLHAKSEATSVIDMLRASRKAAAIENVTLNTKLFLLGYSQGGHATMAAHREIESLYQNEFQITACAPMSGPYDISRNQLDSMLRDEPYNGSLFLPYAYMGSKDAYNFTNAYSDVFVYPYDSLVPALFDGMHDYWTINSYMPDTPNVMLQPSVLNSLRNHTSTDKFYMALDDNNLCNWKPLAPMNLIYCDEDDLVVYQNALTAYNAFITNGATNVTLQNAGPYNHQDCTLNALLAAKIYFDGYY